MDATSIAIRAAVGQLKTAYDGWKQQKREEKTAALLEQISTLQARSPEALDAAVLQLAISGGEPAFDALEWYFVFLRDSLDPVVMPCAARLTAAYVAKGRSRDKFFRRSADILTELDSAEFAALRNVFATAGEVLDASPKKLSLMSGVTIHPKTDSTSWKLAFEEPQGQTTWSQKTNALPQLGLAIVRQFKLAVDPGVWAEDHEQYMFERPQLPAFLRMRALLCNGTAEQILGDQ